MLYTYAVNSQLKELFLQQRPLIYKKGQVILHGQTGPADIFYIEKGHIRVSTITAGGEQKTYVFFNPGIIFPLNRIISDKTHNLFYDAMEDVTLRKISKQQFQQFIQGKPEVLIDLLYQAIEVHDIYIERVDTLEYTNAYARLISRLLTLAKRFGKEEGNRVKILIPVTHQDIANTSAMTRETTTREIDKLVKKGLLVKNGKEMVVPDMKLLQKELDIAAEKKLL